MIEIDQFNKYFHQIDNETFEARFTLCHEIGRGAGSTVQKAKDNNSQDGCVAIKLYNRNQLKQHTRIDVVREIQILNYIKQNNFSQHFVNLVDAFKIVHKDSYKTQYCLVMDLCDLSLEQLVNNKQELLKLPEKERIKLCLKIAKGVECLHSINLLHRDLKPDNILLKKTSESYEPFISDFGHSKENKVFMTSLRGTPLYVDPALQNTENYGFQWDIYSLGLIFLRVMSGQFIIKLPYPLPVKRDFHLMLEPALKNINKTLRDFEFNEKVKEIIENCLIKKRWQIQKIVQSLQNILNSMFKQSKISEQLTFQSVGESKKQKISMVSVRTQSIAKSLQVAQESVIMKKKSQSQFTQSNPQSLIMQKKAISSKFKQKESKVSEKGMKSAFSDKSSSKKNSPNKSLIKNQSQMIKSEQSIKFEQIKQINQPKNEKKTSKIQKNKKEFMGKMFGLRNKLAKNLEGFNEQVQKLEVIKKYEDKLQKIQLIEKSSIKRQTKNVLMTLAFIYLKMILKEHLKEIQNDEFLVKQINSFYDKVDSLFGPLLVWMKKNEFKMSKDARSLLWGQTNADSNYVQKQFYQIVRSQCPLQRSILQRFIL